MSKCKTINSTDDNIDSMDKLNHSDKITINKLEYVWEEASYMSRHDSLCQMIVSKHLYNIKEYCCVGEFSINQDKICLLSDGLEYFMEVNGYTLEEQIAKTISHEIMHRILFYEHGEDECRTFDNIAESLKEYGLW